MDLGCRGRFRVLPNWSQHGVAQKEGAVRSGFSPTTTCCGNGDIVNAVSGSTIALSPRSHPSWMQGSSWMQGYASGQAYAEQSLLVTAKIAQDNTQKSAPDFC